MMYYSRSEIIKKVIAYARYSSTHQNSVSIDIQLKGIREYCEKNGYEIVRVFIDEAKSGCSTENRLQYQGDPGKICVKDRIRNILTGNNWNTNLNLKGCFLLWKTQQKIY